MSCFKTAAPRLARCAFQDPSSATLLRRTIRTAATSTTTSTTTSDKPPTASLSPRWLSDVKTRIGECIKFGLNPTQTQEACAILHEVAHDWRGLVAGSEGFLTDKDSRGLYRQEVVWGEMPRLTPFIGHVNNVVYNRWAESARVNWALNFARQDPTHKEGWLQLMTPLSVGLILRSIRTDYKFPMKYPDRVTVLHRLRSKPSAQMDHFILDVLILSELHRRPAARCVEDIVVYDYQQAKKAPLRPFMVDMFDKTWRLQEQAKKAYGHKVNDLIGRVRALEKDSWDRPDAKEDLGTANNP
ncbi:hypothetical protein BU24DRAFT_355025 [Aaosphaeria arxii CBS 175.79]|uniref:Thioesterase/thiol ester dehydrase-isomerase n=1 Tax=Aaosphaeria arxii CBS 175.79 TaxID=1450172 RepID=A0A6A5XFW3_9PLEO|nr:uncharacterized protein BU24DRAFT_355025 [Aaosphaeria arxii CBS 175.79]KAF2011736.1 hypothetical protein BU24DRAFT_355025 [Aaosphaeria arxii CBS 175.79]